MGSGSFKINLFFAIFFAISSGFTTPNQPSTSGISFSSSFPYLWTRHPLTKTLKSLSTFFLSTFNSISSIDSFLASKIKPQVSIIIASDFSKSSTTLCPYFFNLAFKIAQSATFFGHPSTSK